MRTQPADTAELSLEDFLKKAKVSLNPRGKQRRPVDAFRTVCWFNWLRKEAGATATYQMDTKVEALAIECNSGAAPDNLSNKNKWRSARLGRHTPSVDLTELVATIYPYSAQLLNHVLWDVLRFDLPVKEHSKHWQLRLHHDILSIAFRQDLYGQTIKGQGGFSRQVARQLERRASLDALGALILQLRLAVDSRDQTTASMCQESIVRVVLILTPKFMELGIAQPITDYINRFVMPLVADGRHHAVVTESSTSTAYALYCMAFGEIWHYKKISPEEFSEQAKIQLQHHLISNWMLANHSNTRKACLRTLGSARKPPGSFSPP